MITSTANPIAPKISQRLLRGCAGAATAGTGASAGFASCRMAPQAVQVVFVSMLGMAQFGHGICLGGFVSVLNAPIT
jgi:hypothetical protein